MHSLSLCNEKTSIVLDNLGEEFPYRLEAVEKWFSYRYFFHKLCSTPSRGNMHFPLFERL